jgi:DNA-binding response OmpR family regulator
VALEIECVDRLYLNAEQRRRVVRVGRLTVDRDARTAHVDDQPLQLTRLDDLLQTLAGQPQKAFSRDELIREVWGYDPAAAPAARTVGSTAHRLRKKLEHAGAEPIMHSIRGRRLTTRPVTTGGRASCHRTRHATQQLGGNSRAGA